MNWVFFFLLSSSLALAGVARTNYEFELGKTACVEMDGIPVSFSVQTNGNSVYLKQGGSVTKIEKVFGTDAHDSNRTFLFKRFGYSVFFVDSSGVGSGKFRIAVLHEVADAPTPTPPPKGYNAFVGRPTPPPAPRW